MTTELHVFIEICSNEVLQKQLRLLPERRKICVRCQNKTPSTKCPICDGIVICYPTADQLIDMLGDRFHLLSYHSTMEMIERRWHCLIGCSTKNEWKEDKMFYGQSARIALARACKEVKEIENGK